MRRRRCNSRYLRNKRDALRRMQWNRQGSERHAQAERGKMIKDGAIALLLLALPFVAVFARSYGYSKGLEEGWAMACRLGVRRPPQ